MNGNEKASQDREAKQANRNQEGGRPLMDRPEALLVVFTGELRIDDLHIVGKNLVDDSGLSVRGGVMVGSDATFYFDGDTFLDGTDVGGLAAAPGSDVMPGGLNDCIPIGVLEGEMGYD